MPANRTISRMIDLRDLIELLRQHPLPAPFNLALYSENQGRTGLKKALRIVCRTPDDKVFCTPECDTSWDKVVSQAIQDSRPIVHTCPRGFVGFAVPFPSQEGIPDCLIGGGLCIAEKVSAKTNESDLVTQIDLVRTNSLDEVRMVADELHQLLPRFIDQQVHTKSLERTTRRLEAVRELSRDLSNCTDVDQALATVTEALVVLFDLPKVLVLQQTASGKPLTIHSTLGVDTSSLKIDTGRLFEQFTDDNGQCEALPGEELALLFPGIEAESAYLFSLGEKNRRHGIIALFDVDLHNRDQALIELLVCRLAALVERLRSEEEHLRERRFSARLVSMISALALIDNREELYRQILDMSAELLNATSGSLMLLDEVNGTLGIQAAMGMSASLARSMTVPFGEGISGQVAKSGFPLLVNDIERDNRVAAPNRPRFKTKSFICLPLDIGDRLIGVLNLADKSDNTSFTEVDLKLVQSFTQHAIQMIDRASTLEKAGKFEKLSVTDSLTSLYNRRFLETRLQEELSRSQRQKQSFCVILGDLDNFKLYNDICGHLAGDKALRKAAKLMLRTARDMDVVTRYGGEEFCLILPGTSKKESIFVAERIRRSIETEIFPGETHLPLGRLTISLGVAAYPEDGTTHADLLHAADLALYQAKDQGRNRLVLYEDSMEESPLENRHQN